MPVVNGNSPYAVQVWSSTKSIPDCYFPEGRSSSL